MKVSGFTFVRNAIKYDYPVVEAINSILPICDEFVVSVGNSDDDTLQLIQSINSPKIKIIESVWDDNLRKGGKILAVETDKALRAVSDDSDWAFSMQADEVYHENDLQKIEDAMYRWKDDKNVEGLLFNHINFYGSYDYIVYSHKWLRKELRVIRNDKKISSYKDGFSFRKDGKKLKVKFVDALIHHYGWVKDPYAMQKKQQSFNKYWHDDKWLKKNIANLPEFDYTKMNALKKFSGTHPKVMEKRIAEKNWNFVFDVSKSQKPSLRIRILDFMLEKTGYNVGELKNYKLI